MHELSYARSMIEQIEAFLQKEKFTRISSINLKIGKMSGIDPLSLEFCFDIVAKGTIAEGAKINIEHVPLKIFCHKCNIEIEPTKHVYACPVCAGIDIQTTSGNLAQLLDVEVE